MEATAPATKSHKLKTFGAAIVVGIGVTLFLAFGLDSNPRISDCFTGRIDDKDHLMQTDSFTTYDHMIAARGFIDHPKVGWMLRDRWIAANVPGGPKDETITERSTRIDATQLSNTPQFSNPNAGYSANPTSTFGQVTSTIGSGQGSVNGVGGGRTLQASAKITF